MGRAGAAARIRNIQAGPAPAYPVEMDAQCVMLRIRLDGFLVGCTREIVCRPGRQRCDRFAVMENGGALSREYGLTELLDLVRGSIPRLLAKGRV
jgi:hypothetical protein